MNILWQSEMSKAKVKSYECRPQFQYSSPPAAFVQLAACPPLHFGFCTVLISCATEFVMANERNTGRVGEVMDRQPN